jgi:hypothetical protein
MSGKWLNEASDYKNNYMKLIAILSVTIFLLSCGAAHRFKKDKAAFDASSVVTKYKAIGDMNDSFFEIRENNFFEFYMQLFDSVKNTRYPGKYTTNGDTLYLNFYNKKGEDLLGSKAIINKTRKEIIFFDHYPGIKKRLIFN